MSTNDLSQSVIFPVGKKFESEHFNGTVWLNMLTPFESAQPIANVTFEPSCRNSWHKHAGGQILLVTGGRGYYQQWGQTARELYAGDVVEIPAEVRSSTRTGQQKTAGSFTWPSRSIRRKVRRPGWSRYQMMITIG